MTDLLGWYRQILFVEGAQDETILQVLLADEIDRDQDLDRAHPQGVKDAGTVVEARLLKFTDARAILLSRPIRRVRRRVLAHYQVPAAAAGDLRTARAHASKAFDGNDLEARFLNECSTLLLRDRGSGR